LVKIIELDDYTELPWGEMVMFDSVCPYCGKEIKIIHVENTKKNNYKEIKKENRND